MALAKRRVVITGMGLISPLGSSPAELWDALQAGQSGVGPLSVTAGGPLPVDFGAEARQFANDDIDSFGPLEKEQKKAIRKGLKVMCRECQMGVAAAQLALNDSGIGAGKIAAERIGVVFGADYMLSMPDDFCEGIAQCLSSAGEFEFSRWAVEGLPKMSPLWLLKYLPNMPASHMAIYNDLRGPNNSLTLREAAANAAVAEAYQTILRGSADVMLVGATGTRLHPMKMLHAVQQEEVASVNGDPAVVARPFDRNRSGVVLGEGAGAVVLEELEFARARGARIWGEVLAGSANSSVGRRLQAQRARAMTIALQAVMRGSGLKADDVGHVHAHGLSTRTCDKDEAEAILTVFGTRKDPVPVVAAKSNFGNLGAGSGLVELIASLLALEARRLFPMLNYQTPDPECPVAVVTDASTPAGDSFVNLSVTPQGQASAVLVRRLTG
ncbi:MAG: beta-ketoacyl-[acyl-carrier-protein] synthase family protein [Planctomycetota bacterium]